MNILKRLFKKKETKEEKKENVFTFEMNVGSGAYKAQGSSLEECKNVVMEAAQKVNTKTPDYIN